MINAVLYCLCLMYLVTWTTETLIVKCDHYLNILWIGNQHISLTHEKATDFISETSVLQLVTGEFKKCKASWYSPFCSGSRFTMNIGYEPVTSWFGLRFNDSEEPVSNPEPFLSRTPLQLVFRSLARAGEKKSIRPTGLRIEERSVLMWI